MNDERKIGLPSSSSSSDSSFILHRSSFGVPMPITVVAAEPIEGQVKREIAIVSSLGEHVVGNYVLVRIADEAGHIGLGEASVTAVWSGETQTGTITLIREVLAPLVVGADPFDSEWIFR